VQRGGRTFIAVAGGILLAWAPGFGAARVLSVPVQQPHQSATLPVAETTSQSTSDDTGLPAIIRKAILGKMKRAACLTDAIPDAAVLKSELTADHITDYVVEYALIPCTDVSLGQALKECGPGGCTVETWVSGEGTWRLASSDVLRGVKKGKPRDDRETLIIATNGSACGQADAKSCFFQVWWNGERFDGERVAGRKCAANENSWDCERSRD